MPDNVQARKVLGATRIKMREPAKAIEALLPGRRHQRCPAPGPARQCLHAQGDREQGQEWLNRAVEISPDVAALRTQLALSLLAGGQTDKAVTELQSAVDLGQDILQADVLLVLAHLKNGRFDEALKASTSLEQRKPDNPIAYNLSGLAYLSKGDLVNAGERFKKALAVDPSFTTAELNLARIDVASNALDAAEARYKRVLQDRPQTPRRHARAGRPGRAPQGHGRDRYAGWRRRRMPTPPRPNRASCWSASISPRPTTPRH